MCKYVTMSVFDKLSAGKRVDEFPNPRVKGLDGVSYHIIDGVEITVKRMSKDEVEWYIKRDGDFVIMSSSDRFFPTDLVAGVANKIYNENAELSQHTGYIRSCNTGSASNCFKAEKHANAVAILRNVGYNVVEL